MKRIGRIPGDDVAQLEEQHGDNDRRVDSTSHHQTGSERKASEPATHRTFEDELRNTPDRDAEDQPIEDTYFHPDGRGEAACENKPDRPDDAADDDGGQQSQLSFKPRVHAAPSRALPARIWSTAVRYHRAARCSSIHPAP